MKAVRIVLNHMMLNIALNVMRMVNKAILNPSDRMEKILFMVIVFRNVELAIYNKKKHIFAYLVLRNVNFALSLKMKMPV